MEPLHTGLRRMFLCLLVAGMAVGIARAQQAPANGTPAQQNPPATTPDDSGPVSNDGAIVLPKKKEEPAPPPAPAAEKTNNPNGEIYSLRVDVPIVNLDVNVLLDRTHDFVPG